MDQVPTTPYARHERLRNDRQLRYNTFKNADWMEWPVSLEELTEEMMIWTGRGDQVMCTYCGGMLDKWNPGNKVAGEHAKSYPHCPWILERRRGGGMKNVEAALPQFPQYADEKKRLESFNDRTGDWLDQKPSISSLANAGFYYMRGDDETQCYQCGGIAYDWEKEDDPKLAHDYMFPECLLTTKH